MPSKLIALLLALALTGCSLRLNDETAAPAMKVSAGAEGCLAGAGETLNKYFEGKIEEKELEGFWVCLEKALQMFTENTKGKNEQEFTSGELSGFLSKYFLKGRVIPEGFLRETMHLKQGMLGGSASSLTKTELRQTLALVKALHKVSVRLRPHMPITVSSLLARKASADQFELTLKDLQEGLAEVGVALKDYQGAYHFDRLSSLLTETKSFLYPTDAENKTWLDAGLRWSLALRPAKAIFISPPQDEIRQTDWSKIYYLAPRYYGLYLRAQFYALAEGKYSSGDGLVRLEGFFDDTLKLLELVLNHRPDGTVSEAELDDFLKALHQSGMLPCRLETAQALLRALFGRVLGEGHQKYSLSVATLARLRENLAFGTEGLRGLEAFYQQRLGADALTKSLPRQEVAAMNVDTLLATTVHKNALSKEALKAVAAAATDVRTSFPNASLTVFVPAGEEATTVSFAHLAKTHLFGTLNRLLLKAYGDAGASSLTEAQVTQVVDDIFPFLVDLHVVNESTRASVAPRLFEASLFLYASDGDKGLTLSEATEFQSLLLSTILRAKKMHADIAASCSGAKVNEAGQQAIPAECYRTKFLEKQKSYWAYIPGLSDYLDRLPRRNQEELFKRLEKFLRKGKEGQPFLPNDSQAFVLMPYYVELLFSRFDKDRNGFLTNAEADAAYSVFRPFLAVKATEKGLTSDDDHRALYSFLLAYQELPQNMKGTWLWRRYVTGAKNFRVDRGQVIQIFEKLLSI